MAARVREGKDTAIHEILRDLKSLSQRERDLLGVEPQYTEAVVRSSLAGIMRKQSKAIAAQQEVEVAVRNQAAEDLRKEAERAERPLGGEAAATGDDKKEDGGGRRRRKVEFGPKC